VVWLDAHWCGQETFGASAECPVLDEIRVLNSQSPESVILIDDARYFIAPPPPPHNATDWPGVLELCDLLTSGPVDRYAVIVEDVFAVVPAASRTALDDFVRQVLYPTPQPLPLWRRALRKVFG
jgi:hypothetical protein